MSATRAPAPRLLVLGATSGIARAIAAEFAGAGSDLVLLARDADELAAVAADLRVRFGVDVATHPFDALASEGHAEALRAVLEAPGAAIGGAVLCYGYLGDQATAQRDWAEARRILDTNFTGAVSALAVLAEHLEARGEGFLCAIGSVAGDRGRQSNYVYGAAKAGLAAYLSGLRNRLAPAGVHVLTVKPGFVDTPMTRGKPGMFLVAPPAAVARDVRRAILAGRNTLYTPWFWQAIMAVIRAIPEPIFKRMRL